MAKFQQSITVSAPPEKAYEFLADISRHAEWSGHGLQVQKTSDGPVAVGATYSTIGKQMGTHKGEVTVTQLNPYSQITYESLDDTGHFRHGFLLAARDGGTEITKTVEPLKKGLLLTLLGPGMGLLVPRGLRADLAKIKERLEAQAPAL